MKGSAKVHPGFKIVKPTTSASDHTMVQRVRIDAAGRVVIPVEMRKALDIHDGQDLTVSLESGAIKLRTRALTHARIRAIARAHRKDPGSMVDRFLAERRADAASE